LKFVPGTSNGPKFQPQLAADTLPLFSSFFGAFLPGLGAFLLLLLLEGDCTSGVCVCDEAGDSCFFEEAAAAGAETEELSFILVAGAGVGAA